MIVCYCCCRFVFKPPTQKTLQTVSTPPAVVNNYKNCSDKNIANTNHFKPATVLENSGSNDSLKNQRFLTPSLTTTTSSNADCSAELPAVNTSKQLTPVPSILAKNFSNPSKYSSNILKESNTLTAQVIMINY